MQQERRKTVCKGDGPEWKKRRLSASVDGRGIKVGATATPGTLVHQATPSLAANEWDEVWLYVVNSSAAAVKLTLESGGTTNPDDQIELTIPPENGLQQVMPGLILQNSREVRAFAATANVLVLHGFVNRFEDKK
jgi:hypothetical protein